MEAIEGLVVGGSGAGTGLIIGRLFYGEATVDAKRPATREDHLKTNLANRRNLWVCKKKKKKKSKKL